jgi:hypothetical protein
MVCWEGCINIRVFCILEGKEWWSWQYYLAESFRKRNYWKSVSWQMNCC